MASLQEEGVEEGDISEADSTTASTTGWTCLTRHARLKPTHPYLLAKFRDKRAARAALTCRNVILMLGKLDSMVSTFSLA